MAFFNSLRKKTRYSQNFFVRNEIGIRTKFFSSPKSVKILIENSGKILSLEEVAFDIWILLKKPLSFEKLIKELKKQYEAPEKDLKKDTISFLKELQKHKLVKTLEKN